MGWGEESGWNCFGHTQFQSMGQDNPVKSRELELCKHTGGACLTKASVALGEKKQHHRKPQEIFQGLIGNMASLESVE